MRERRFVTTLRTREIVLEQDGRTRRRPSRRGATGDGAREPTALREHGARLGFVLLGEQRNLPREFAIGFF